MRFENEHYVVVCPRCGSDDLTFLIFGWKCNVCGKHFVEGIKKKKEGDENE